MVIYQILLSFGFESWNENQNSSSGAPEDHVWTSGALLIAIWIFYNFTDKNPKQDKFLNAETAPKLKVKGIKTYIKL